MPPSLLSAAEVAALLGCTKRTVNRAAVALGVGQIVGKSRIFTRGDVAKIRRQIKPGPGNPNFGKPTGTEQ